MKKPPESLFSPHVAAWGHRHFFCSVQVAAAAGQPRTQHSRVGMLRQNNQHTPARAAVLAAVLRTLAALIGGIYYYKNGLKLKLKLGAVIAQRACKDPDTSPPAPFPHHHPAHRPVHSPAGLCPVRVECALDVADDPPGSNGQVSVQVRLPIRHG